ncbi:MAG: hypothetical protein NTZ84_03110, partial [Candidatus Nealsonbacteria bacterium]|nr:hypothetical protein [Candidatus Nealsonbacteria bacterium]
MKKFEKKFIFLAFSLLIFLPVFITAAWIETPSVPTLNLDDSYNCSRINICPCPTFSWTSTNTSPSVYYNLYRINPDGSTSTYPNVLSPFRDEGSGSLSFDGINDYISVPNSSSLQLIYDLNISFWAFPTNVAKSRQTLVAKAYGGEFDLTMEPDGSLSYYQGSGGGNNAPYMTCYTPTTTISTQVTNINDVGQGSSISIDYSGHPIISYMDNTVGKLMFTRCGVNSCSDNSNNTTTQIANTDNVGSYTSLTRSALGWPIISYMNNTDGDLMITRCGNDYCSSGNNTTQIANTDNVGSYTSIAIGTDGLPIISYMNDTDGDLMITKCGTWNCISGNTTTQITDTDMTGYETFIAIGTDGLPIISYRNATDSDLMITKCGNVSCSSGNTTIQIADTDMIGYESSIAIATSGLPIISYRNNTDGDLMITKCSNASCSATSTNITTQITDTDMTGYESSIAIPSDGLPIISYRNNTDGDLMITKCGNVSCSSGNTTNQIADTDMTGYDSSIAIGFDGLPIISYRNNTDGNLMITKCSNSSCNATPTRFFSNNTWVNAAVTRDFSGWAPAKIIGIYKNDVLQNIACSSWVN